MSTQRQSHRGPHQEPVLDAAPHGCTKRGYPSAAKARRANRWASFRIKAYRCDICTEWHVANSEKR